MKHLFMSVMVMLSVHALASDHVIKFVQDLRVGPTSEDPVFDWVGPNVSVTADSEGHIYVTDPKENRIIQLDPIGKFVRQIGGPGQGPGEFQFLVSTHILADGTAMVFENQQATNIFNSFGPGFQYRDKIVRQDLSLMMQNISYAPNGKMLGGAAAALDQSDNSLITKSFVADENFKIIKEWELDKSPAFDPAKISDRAYWVKFLASRFKIFANGKTGYVTFDEENRVYTAMANRYEIQCWNRDMSAFRSFNHKYKPIPRTQQEIDATVAPVHEAIVAALPAQLQSLVNNEVVREAIEMAEFAPVQNPINGLRASNDGKIAVFHELSYAKNLAFIDFFTTQGDYIGSYAHPNVGAANMFLADGYAYMVESNDQDDKEVVRYRIEFTPES